jgi:hypothetical protein
MDFLKMMLSADENRDTEDEAIHERLFEGGLECGRDVAKIILDRAKQTAGGDDNPYYASLFLFVAAWTVIGIFFSGVSKSIQSHGLRTPVARVWHLLRIALGSGDNMEHAMSRLATFDEDFKEGKYDEIF